MTPKQAARALAALEKEELEEGPAPPPAELPIRLKEDVVKLVDWIPKKRYMELYGESEASIFKRISSQAWTLGQQFSRPEGAGLWISIKGVNEWAARHTPDGRMKQAYS